MNRDEVQVLVPSLTGGVVVVGLDDLAVALAELGDGDITEEQFESVLTQHGIESTMTARDDVGDLIGRVRELNRTGDVDTFWGLR